jgi:hypothetical protein
MPPMEEIYVIQILHDDDPRVNCEILPRLNRVNGKMAEILWLVIMKDVPPNSELYTACKTIAALPEHHRKHFVNYRRHYVCFRE